MNWLILLVLRHRGKELKYCIKEIFVLWFDRPEMRYVRAKIGLAGHLDRWLGGRYFQAWSFEPKHLPQLQVNMNLKDVWSELVS